jgi:hypothetical protein
VRAPRGQRLRRIRVTASKGRVRTRRSGRGYRIRLDLRGAPRGEVRVRIRATTARGRTLRQTRTFRTCTRRKAP